MANGIIIQKKPSSAFTSYLTFYIHKKEFWTKESQIKCTLSVVLTFLIHLINFLFAFWCTRLCTESVNATAFTLPCSPLHCCSWSRKKIPNWCMLQMQCRSIMYNTFELRTSGRGGGSNGYLGREVLQMPLNLHHL